MDRFLGISSSSSSNATNGGDELNEDDILWTHDTTDQDHHYNRSAATDSNNRHRRPSFARNNGILAALPQTEAYEVLCRKPIISESHTTRPGQAIPRPLQQERERLTGSRKKLQQHSAPVNVPLLSIAVARERNKKFMEVDYDDEGEQEMLPPHEIVARGSVVSPKTTFSVLEGVGRTLKGRDLRQVRNAIWRQTGFLD